MKARATIRLNFASEKQLSALIEALTPEIQKPVSTRSKIELLQDDNTIVLNVEAQDTVALRATLNSYLRWINSTLSVLETVDKV